MNPKISILEGSEGHDDFFPPTQGDATGSSAAVLKVDGHKVEHEIEEPIVGATIPNVTGLEVE
jgi:hypothetical protein